MEKSKNKLEEIEQPFLLVVEGDNDVHFFVHFIIEAGLNDIQVVKMENGKDSLPQTLKAIPYRPGFNDMVRGVYVIRDADDKPESAYESVSKNLDTMRKNIEMTEGVNDINTDFRLVPENGPGNRETLCLMAIESKDDKGILGCVDDYFKCIEKKDVKIKPKDMDKARLMAYLSSRDKYDWKQSTAVKEGHIPCDSHVFNYLKDFFNSFPR